MADRPTGVSVCDAAFDLGKDDEALDSILDGGVIRQLLNGLTQQDFGG
ncbi:hypothetical protein Strain138_002145 [Pseudogemmatithrix spongiicola]|uniref:Uncharacterized protein n=1 Tax=Pseudogemmatithrix spongiicola TaxID=3062599 RepID=A0AA49K0X7_9BACT|nr:hypothetical protein Strain138_002145 [Gemmatimonadaceae bacterium 'strain 138']WKW15742.1 hypothetical protein Strain318_002144 [Gemmatimonadaceae bacterium 'strain 318']